LRNNIEKKRGNNIKIDLKEICSENFRRRNCLALNPMAVFVTSRVKMPGSSTFVFCDCEGVSFLLKWLEEFVNNL
jgi:hypothetical protein